MLIVQPPSRPNIYYVVYEKTTDLEGTVSNLLNELRQKRTEMEHTIIFFQRYDDCTRCYLYFRSELGPELSHPVGFPNIASLRLCDMFTACVRSEVKDTCGRVNETILHQECVKLLCSCCDICCRKCNCTKCSQAPAV